MKSIDFLPEEYRLRRLRRQGVRAEIAVVALFGGITACVFCWQNHQTAGIHADLQRLETNFREVSERITRAETARTELAAERTFADLYALRNHSWPRTAAIAVVAQKLPEEMTLLELQLTQEANGAGLDPVAPPATSETEAKKSPADIDAQRLRLEAERVPTVLFLSGRTPQPESVYRFVRELGATPMFQAVQLESLVGQKGEAQTAGRSDFRIRVQLRPGYGVKGAPAAPPEAATIATKREES